MATKKKSVTKKRTHKKVSKKKETSKKQLSPKKNFPSLNLSRDQDIAMDFATNVYKKFNKIIKSVILFGSTIKQTQTLGSDIDIVIIIDDATIKWDQELIAWYREELENILKKSPYKKELHINTIKLSTWWEDLLRGDPTIMNIIRHGESMIDFAGFYDPLKFLLAQGKIRSTPEAIYSCLQRAPMHLARSRASKIGAIEGLYWTMVDASQAALIAQGVTPPSPEHIPENIKQTFVDKGLLKMKYVVWYKDLLTLHKNITHGETKDLRATEIDSWREKSEEFLDTMANLVEKLIEENK